MGPLAVLLVGFNLVEKKKNLWFIPLKLDCKRETKNDNDATTNYAIVYYI